MTDRPILFSAPMVLALLAGRKTQTRRILKPQPYPLDGRPGFWNASGAIGGRICISDRDLLDLHRKPTVGDMLWVRETHAIVPRTAYRMSEGVQQTLRPDDDHDAAVYQAGWERSKPGRWRPSIHMPRWASRITLKVTEVRVERLQDISDEDAEAEGCPECDVCHDVGWINSGPDGGWQCTAPGCGDAYRDQYARLWDHINGAGAWDANPWVVAISFERVP